MYLTITALLAIALLIFGISIFLRVMEIEVDGARKYNRTQIIEASGISAGDNIMLLDAAAAAQRIKLAMPYINDVTIEPELPATIRITVSESMAVAAIDHRNEVLLIDSSGRVLDRTSTLPKGLIEIRGFIPLEAETGNRLRAMSGSETQLRSLTEVLSAFERASVLSDVSYLDVTHISTISFGFTGRFTVVLGGSANVSHKLSQLPDFISRIDKEKSDDVTGVINMSDASGEWRFIEDR